ncbi:hypothetical protein [Georgenia sp. AZ-5]|uniref:hypothetical protein n=1 Tax=Georgenia sp. AZ-5 TaxID=3367526 RepID=UPI0037541CFA
MRLGSTGKISWIDADDGGDVRDVVTGLPSLAGPDGSAVPEGQLRAGGLVLVDGDDPDRQHRSTGHDLTAPGGLTVHGDTLYVSNRAVVADGGEVVSFELDD